MRPSAPLGTILYRWLDWMPKQSTNPQPGRTPLRRCGLRTARLDLITTLVQPLANATMSGLSLTKPINHCEILHLPIIDTPTNILKISLFVVNEPALAYILPMKLQDQSIHLVFGQLGQVYCTVMGSHTVEVIVCHFETGRMITTRQLEP